MHFFHRQEYDEAGTAAVRIQRVILAAVVLEAITVFFLLWQFGPIAFAPTGVSVALLVFGFVSSLMRIRIALFIYSISTIFLATGAVAAVAALAVLSINHKSGQRQYAPPMAVGGVVMEIALLSVKAYTVHAALRMAKRLRFGNRGSVQEPDSTAPDGGQLPQSPAVIHVSHDPIPAVAPTVTMPPTAPGADQPASAPAIPPPPK